MLKTTVENIMTEHIVTLPQSATIMNAAHILLRFQINGLLVVDKKNSSRVVGVLTTHDLLRLLDKALSKRSHKIKELELEKVGRKSIKNVISKDIIKIQKNDKVAKALSIMHQKSIHTLPVYDGKKLVGVVGKHDILNLAFYSRHR